MTGISLSSRIVSVCLLVFTGCVSAFAQGSSDPETSPAQVVFTADIDHFWEAYDSIQTTSDRAEQVRFINELYIDRATPGLQAFRQVRNYPDTMWVDLLQRFPKFWASVRANTLQAKTHVPAIEQAVAKLRRLYPALRPAQIYFCIGGMNTGGTVMDSISLIGAEVSLADATVDVSEFTEGWFTHLALLFQARRNLDNVAYINVHEYVHTQQGSEGELLLSQVLHEGACDFIAELVLQQPNPNPYIEYGRTHHGEVMTRFREEMFGKDRSAWLYNGGSAVDCVDLGYYVGYAISKAYYERAEDKQRAIREIIELEVSDPVAAVAFLNAAGVYPDTLEVPPPPVLDGPFQVTFEVTVPDPEDSVYLTGSLPELGKWNPAGIELERVGPRLRRITLTTLSPAEFKFTRGSWPTEALVAGRPVGPNLELQVTGDTTLEFTIERWKDR